jgi:crotonobetainyl-CoA:carnitine CoA-transferase CaiB-like acyl-CoA transferase
VLQVFDEAQWQALKKVAPGLAGFGDCADRLARVDALDQALGAWTRTVEADALMLQLQNLGIPCAKVQGMESLLTDPHLVARQFWPRLERAFVGSQPHPVAPYRADGLAYGIDTPAPTLGQHNAQVLTELLGLGAAELAALETAGVIGDRPVMSQRSIE